MTDEEQTKQFNRRLRENEILLQIRDAQGVDAAKKWLAQLNTGKVIVPTQRDIDVWRMSAEATPPKLGKFNWQQAILSLIVEWELNRK